MDGALKHPATINFSSSSFFQSVLSAKGDCGEKAGLLDVNLYFAQFVVMGSSTSCSPFSIAR